MRAVERGVTPDELQALGRRNGRPEWIAAAGLLREYEQVTALKAPGAFDAAELIQRAIGELGDNDALLAAERSKRRRIFVDEYQDTDPSQTELLRLISTGADELILIGDPDQSIYAFRGADQYAMADLDQHFGAAHPTEPTRPRLGACRCRRAAAGRSCSPPPDADRGAACRARSAIARSADPGQPAGTIAVTLLSAAEPGSRLSGNPAATGPPRGRRAVVADGGAGAFGGTGGGHAATWSGRFRSPGRPGGARCAHRRTDRRPIAGFAAVRGATERDNGGDCRIVADRADRQGRSAADRADASLSVASARWTGAGDRPADRTGCGRIPARVVAHSGRTGVRGDRRRACGGRRNRSLPRTCSGRSGAPAGFRSGWNAAASPAVPMVPVRTETWTQCCRCSQRRRRCPDRSPGGGIDQLHDWVSLLEITDSVGSDVLVRLARSSRS